RDALAVSRAISMGDKCPISGAGVGGGEEVFVGSVAGGIPSSATSPLAPSSDEKPFPGISWGPHGEVGVADVMAEAMREDSIQGGAITSLAPPHHVPSGGLVNIAPCLEEVEDGGVVAHGEGVEDPSAHGDEDVVRIIAEAMSEEGFNGDARDHDLSVGGEGLLPRTADYSSALEPQLVTDYPARSLGSIGFAEGPSPVTVDHLAVPAASEGVPSHVGGYAAGTVGSRLGVEHNTKCHEHNEPKVGSDPPVGAVVDPPSSVKSWPAGALPPSFDLSPRPTEDCLPHLANGYSEAGEPRGCLQPRSNLLAPPLSVVEPKTQDEMGVVPLRQEGGGVVDEDGVGHSGDQVERAVGEGNGIGGPDGVLTSYNGHDQQQKHEPFGDDVLDSFGGLPGWLRGEMSLSDLDCLRLEDQGLEDQAQGLGSGQGLELELGEDQQLELGLGLEEHRREGMLHGVEVWQGDWQKEGFEGERDLGDDLGEEFVENTHLHGHERGGIHHPPGESLGGSLCGSVCGAVNGSGHGYGDASVQYNGYVTYPDTTTNGPLLSRPSVGGHPSCRGVEESVVEGVVEGVLADRGLQWKVSRELLAHFLRAEGGSPERAASLYLIFVEDFYQLRNRARRRRGLPPCSAPHYLKEAGTTTEPPPAVEAEGSPSMPSVMPSPVSSQGRAGLEGQGSWLRGSKNLDLDDPDGPNPNLKDGLSSSVLAWEGG
ncbi:unnamed protein product, partial [Discosporangium mesarthrocarpum]